MTSIKKALIFGFLVWAIPFAVAFLIFSIRASNKDLFDSLMAVVEAGVTVIFAVLYFKKAEKNFVQEGLKLGLIWLVISLVIDLAMFTRGPMKMSPALYFSDIGVVYLMLPIITTGFGYLTKSKRQS